MALKPITTYSIAYTTRAQAKGDKIISRSPIDRVVPLSSWKLCRLSFFAGISMLLSVLQTLGYQSAFCIACAISTVVLATSPALAIAANQGGKEDLLVWTSIPSSERSAVLELLSAQTEANYEKIRTWTATWSVTMGQFLSDTYLAGNYKDRLSLDDISGGVIQEFVFDIKTVIDLNSGNAFRDKVSRRMRFLKPDSNNEIKIPNTSAFAGRSVVTAEHYLYFSPKVIWGSFGFLPDHPQAQNKHAAFRVSTGESKKQDHGDLLDPRVFFGVNSIQRFWDFLNVYISKDPTPADGAYLLEGASSPEGKLYRLQTSYRDSELKLTTIWSSTSGFNATSAVLVKGSDGKQVLSDQKWTWRAVDGIFVPSSYKEILFLGNNGSLNYRREVTLKDCELNQPLAPDQFDYPALGLNNGDLVIDHIKNEVLIVDNGMPKKLANFGERYIPPTDRYSIGRLCLIIGNAALVVVLLAIVYRRHLANK